MGNRNFSFGNVSIFFVIGAFLFQSATLFAEISGTEFLNLLNEKDQKTSGTGYKISFVMATQDNQFKDPNQGMVLKDCEATWAEKGSFAMEITYHYEHPPVFGPLGFRRYEPIDYDKDGNLIVWRSLEKHIFFGADRNEVIERIQSFYVDRNGTLVNKGGTQTTVFLFPLGNINHMFEFNQFELAVGRGFSKHLKTVTSIKSLSSGLMKVISHGSHGSGLKGNWELILDPNSDWLVREATLTTDGHKKPKIVISSSGVIVKDELKMAKYGTFRYSNLLELSVEVTDISKVVGTNTLNEEVLSRLNSPMPPGSVIMDMRGEKPVITTVK